MKLTFAVFSELGEGKQAMLEDLAKSKDQTDKLVSVHGRSKAVVTYDLDLSGQLVKTD